MYISQNMYIYIYVSNNICILYMYACYILHIYVYTYICTYISTYIYIYIIYMYNIYIYMYLKIAYHNLNQTYFTHYFSPGPCDRRGRVEVEAPRDPAADAEGMPWPSTQKKHGIWGKSRGNLWNIYGKSMENLWEKLWKIYGKSMWKIYGNIWKRYGT